jgi:hypothetical protein
VVVVLSSLQLQKPSWGFELDGYHFSGSCTTSRIPAPVALERDGQKLSTISFVSLSMGILTNSDPLSQMITPRSGSHHIESPFALMVVCENDIAPSKITTEATDIRV